MTINHNPSGHAASLSLPRILCLHGGGVNARVFEMQSRAIVACLRPFFRLVFVDGPYIGPPHPDIVSVYGHLGPFRSWLRSLDPKHHADDSIVGQYLRSTMEADLGSGEWVGVLGFSQGAKIAASLLWAQEEAVRQAERPLTNFRFGIIMAGSPPIVQLDSHKTSKLHFSGAGVIENMTCSRGDERRIMSTPTVHVHGMQDPGLDRHRLLLKSHFSPETTHLVEWNGGHRLPIKSKDVFAIMDALVEAVQDSDIIRTKHLDERRSVSEGQALTTARIK